MEFDQTLQALGSAPIPGATATGQAARYEPEFEQMQAEVDKLIALGGGSPDWTLVADFASTLLTKKSKDLLVAAYLCAALRETRGWAGLADGLNVLKTLVTTHWDGLFPERLRARKTAVDWLLDRLKPLAEEATVQDGDGDALTACIGLLDEIVAFGETRWEGDPPTLWSLTKILQGKLGAVPAPVAVADDAPSAVATAASPSGAVAMSSPLSTTADRSAVYRQIQHLAEQLIANEPHSPVPYLLRRAASWGPMALPQLYAELQRTGSMWDLVLQQVSGAADAGTSGGGQASPAFAEPATEPGRPRGDF